MGTQQVAELGQRSTSDSAISNSVCSTDTSGTEAARELPQTGKGEPLPTNEPKIDETGAIVSPDNGRDSEQLREDATPNSLSFDKSKDDKAKDARRRKILRNRRKRANKQKRRVPKEPRVKLTAEERERVCALFRDYPKHLEPILRTARHNVEKDWRAYYLRPQDKDDIIGAIAWRVHRYLPKFIEADNPWALLKTVVGHCIYEYLKHRKHHLLVTFRRRARIRSLIERLRLNKADIISDTRNEDGKRTLELWATTAQVKELRCHDQIESLVVLHDNVNVESIEEVAVADPSDAISEWETLEDLKTAHRILQPEMEKPAAVFDLFVLQKLRLREVAKLLGLSVRWCWELLRKFIRRVVERFPELKEGLLSILRQLW